jgi:hypothetical protein
MKRKNPERRRSGFFFGSQGSRKDFSLGVLAAEVIGGQNHEAQDDDRGGDDGVHIFLLRLSLSLLDKS